MKNFLKTINLNSKISTCIGALIIFCIYTSNIFNLKIPTILYDEIGYWGNAATLLGYDWSGITKSMGYYGYGYSLVLLIAFKLGVNAYVRYRIAILINVFFVIIIYFSIIKISNIKFNKMFNIEKIIAGVCILMYPGLRMNANIAWSEILLSSLFCIAVVLLEKYKEKNKNYFLYIFWFMMLYLYSVHQRSIGVLLVGAAIILILSFDKTRDKKLNFKLYTFLLIETVVFLCFHNLIKQYLYANFYNLSSNVGANDYSGQTDKMKSIFSLEGFEKLIYSFVGKVYYLVIGTYGIFGISLYQIVKTIINKFFLEKKALKTIITELFLLASIFCTLIISSIFLIEGDRYDTLVYGRYTEWLLPPILLYGIYFLIKEIEIKVIFFQIVIINILALITKFAYNNLEIKAMFFDTCAPAFSRYFNTQCSNSNYVYELAIFLSSFLFLIIVIQQCKKNTKFYKKSILIIIAILFFINANYVVENKINVMQNKNQVIIEISNWLEKNGLQQPIYYLKTNEAKEHYEIADLQFIRLEERIHIIDKFEFNKIPLDVIIVVDKNAVINKSLLKKIHEINELEIYRYY